jgi:hypothetical protein
MDTLRLGHTDVSRNELAEHEEYQQINREVRFQEMKIIDPRQNFVMTLIRCATEQLLFSGCDTSTVSSYKQSDHLLLVTYTRLSFYDNFPYVAE